MYVVGVDPQNNTVILGTDKELFFQNLIVTDINLISVENLETPHHLQVKMRYQQREQGAIVTLTDIVVFSAGVDPPFLIQIVHDVLGNQAITAAAHSSTFPQRELEDSIRFRRQEGIEQTIFNLEELSHNDFHHNPPNRCHFCKKELFTKKQEIARVRRIRRIGYRR